MDNREERIVQFWDWHNVEGGFRELGGQPDVLTLRDYLTAGRRLLEVFVYAGIHPVHYEQSTKFHSFMRREGFVVKTKHGKLAENGLSRCNMDVEIALDVLDFARNVRPDTVIIASGDGDFIPVVQRLRDMGIRVEVAATKANGSNELREWASGFVDLGQAVAEFASEIIEEGGDEDDHSDDQWAEG